MCAHPETDKQPGGDCGGRVCMRACAHACELGADSEYACVVGVEDEIQMMVMLNEVLCRREGKPRLEATRAKITCKCFFVVVVVVASLLLRASEHNAGNQHGFFQNKIAGESEGGIWDAKTSRDFLSLRGARWDRTERNWNELRDDFTVEANQPGPSYKSLIMKPPGLLQLITLTLASDEERAEISPPINCMSLIALLGSRAAAMTDRRQKAAGRQMGSRFLVFRYFLLFYSFNITWQKICLQGLKSSQSLSPGNPANCWGLTFSPTDFILTNFLLLDLKNFMECIAYLRDTPNLSVTLITGQIPSIPVGLIGNSAMILQSPHGEPQGLHSVQSVALLLTNKRPVLLKLRMLQHSCNSL